VPYTARPALEWTVNAYTLTFAVLLVTAGRLGDIYGRRRMFLMRTDYGDLLPAFVLMGFGLALTISPMSTAAMNFVSQDKAGLASGILSMTRMVGGTLGVAALARCSSTSLRTGSPRP
jgi:MFS family permease